MKEPKKILSGMQPTGFLHLGNYLGALKNWVKMQDYQAEIFYMIADIHSLTSNQSHYKDEIKTYIRHVVADFIASGIDPERSTIFLQSDIPEHTELYTLLSMITPVSWLERNPTYKEKMDEIKGKDLDNLGFLGYPVLQTADIALYEADHVPVGKDQLPHLEISREIIRRFNYIYQHEILIEPQPILSDVPKLNGLDGRKMSKSYDNAIFIGDDEETTRKKIMSMVTDVKRAYKKDPGHPDECILFSYFKAFSNDQNFLDETRRACEAAEIGCVQDKKKLAELVNDFFRDIRRKREEILSDNDTLTDILKNGALKASGSAKQTMEKVRSAVGMASDIRYNG